MKHDVLRHAQTALVELRKSKPLANPSRVPLVSKTESAEDWLKIEQLFYSCLTTGDERAAESCLGLLEQRFGPSNDKIQSLRGAFDESKATSRQTEDILKKYERDLKENPANISLAKRRVALLRSMGKEQDAVAALCQLLDLSPTDIEAWAELAELYIKRGMYKQAIYCLEEVILVQPNAWNIQARLGEIHLKASCSAGENKLAMAEQISRSFQHFCRSVELCDDYIRGYCGLKQSSSRLIQMDQESSGLFDGISITAVKKLHDQAIVKLQAIADKYSSGANVPPDVVAARLFLQN